MRSDWDSEHSHCLCSKEGWPSANISVKNVNNSIIKKKKKKHAAAPSTQVSQAAEYKQWISRVHERNTSIAQAAHTRAQG